MTCKEALDWCEQFIDNLVMVNVDTKKRTLGLQAMQACKSALEKQIPKKPINAELTVYSGGTQIIYARCPICNQSVSIFNGHQNNKSFRRDEDVFCSYCGQALDWGDSE